MAETSICQMISRETSAWSWAVSRETFGLFGGTGVVAAVLEDLQDQIL